MSQRNNIPDHIKDQANHSWQIELFISLGMIFSLYKIPAVIAKVFQETIINIDYDTTNIIYFFSGVVIARILLFGFAVNLTLRAIWLGLLGIYYSYPNGIKYDQLKYSEYYKDKYNPKFKTLEKVKKLERYSSLSFSLAIISGIHAFGILLTMSLFYFVALRVFDLYFLDDPTTAYVILSFLIFSSLGFFDKFFFGVFKRYNAISRLYYPIHKFLAFFNLTWLIQYEKLTIFSNSKRWKVAIISFLYFLVAVIISGNDLGLSNTMGFSKIEGLDSRQFKNIQAQYLWLQNDEYEDLLKEDDLISIAAIPSFEIEKNHLKVFVTYDKQYDSTFENLSKKNKFDFNSRNSNIQKRLENTVVFRDILNKSMLVKLDSTSLDSLNWYMRQHPITQQLGFETRLDLNACPKGEHFLTIRPIIHKKDGIQDTVGGRWIPFLKLN